MLQNFHSFFMIQGTFFKQTLDPAILPEENSIQEIDPMFIYKTWMNRQFHNINDARTATCSMQKYHIPSATFK